MRPSPPFWQGFSLILPQPERGGGGEKEKNGGEICGGMVIHGMDLVMGMVLDGEEASEEDGDGEEVGEEEPAVGPGLPPISTEQILISTGIIPTAPTVIPTPTEELTGIPFSNPLKRRRKNESYGSPSGPNS